MFNRTIFSKRIKLIRKAYKFTIIEFSSYFKIVSKTSIGFWEKENSIPSADVLADLSTFLGISMDWFAGFSSIPYTKESIENAERNVFNKIEEIDKGRVFLYLFPKEYISCEQREKLYSLPVRANIIMLLHCVYIPYYEKYKTTKDEIQHNTDINILAEDFKQYYFTYKYKLTVKEKTYVENLFLLLNRIVTIPVYNIEQ